MYMPKYMYIGIGYIPVSRNNRPLVKTVLQKNKLSNSHRVGSNGKRYQQSTNADQKSIETEFSIAIWRHTGD